MTPKDTSSAQDSNQKAPVLLNEFVEQDIAPEQTSEINYKTLLNVVPKKRELTKEEEKQSQKVVFYCKQCEEVVETKKRTGKKLKFVCSKCEGQDIYLGTELGIRGFFHV